MIDHVDLIKVPLQHPSDRITPDFGVIVFARRAFTLLAVAVALGAGSSVHAATEAQAIAMVEKAIATANLNDASDADGKMFRKEITDGAAKTGKGWVRYKSKNPVTNQIEAKKTYYQRAGNLIVEAGVNDK